MPKVLFTNLSDNEVVITSPDPGHTKVRAFSVPANGSVTIDMSNSDLIIFEKILSVLNDVEVNWEIVGDASDDPKQTLFQADLYPVVDYISLKEIPVAGASNVELYGSNLMGSANKASKEFVFGDGNITITAKNCGFAGNNISVQFASGEAESVTVVGNEIVVYFTGDSTVNTITSLINSDGAASVLVQATAGGTVTEKLSEVNKTYLEGGKGPSIEIVCAGIPCTVKSVSDIKVVFDIPAMTAGSLALLQYKLGEVIYQISIPVADA